ERSMGLARDQNRNPLPGPHRGRRQARRRRAKRPRGPASTCARGSCPRPRGYGRMGEVFAAERETGFALPRLMLSPVRRALTRDRPSVPGSRRTAAIAAIGPLIVLAGVLWALAQVDRLPLLDPDGRGFWSLAVEPPLLVLMAGLFFHRFIALGLIRDLYRSEVD